METSPLFATPDHAQNPANGKASNTVSDMRMLQEITNRFRSLQVDPAEFACLKAIALFKPGTKNSKLLINLPNSRVFDIL